MVQWTWLTLLALASVETASALPKPEQHDLQKITNEPTINPRKSLLGERIFKSHPKRGKNHFGESPLTSARQRRCHAAERHLRNFRNQPFASDEQGSVETTKRDINSTYGHHHHYPSVTPVYTGSKKDYKALKEYLVLMHQLQRDAYNQLQHKLKESITKTKQPWRDDQVPRPERPLPYPETDHVWNTPIQNPSDYGTDPKWDYSKPYEMALPTETYEPKLFNRMESIPLNDNNLPYIENIAKTNPGFEKLDLDDDKTSSINYAEDSDLLPTIILPNEELEQSTTEANFNELKSPENIDLPQTEETENYLESPKIPEIEQNEEITTQPQEFVTTTTTEATTTEEETTPRTTTTTEATQKLKQKLKEFTEKKNSLDELVARILNRNLGIPEKTTQAELETIMKSLNQIKKVKLPEPDLSSLEDVESTEQVPQEIPPSSTPINQISTTPTTKPVSLTPDQSPVIISSTTEPYHVILLKEKAKKKALKPVKNQTSSLKFLQHNIKTEEPYEIVVETTERPKTTETPEDRLIKLLGPSVDPDYLEEIKREVQDLKRHFEEEARKLAKKPLNTEAPIQATQRPKPIEAEDKIIIPFNENEKKIIVVDPNETGSKQIQFIETHKDLDEPFFSFPGGDPFENDELAKSAQDADSTEETVESEDYAIENISDAKKVPWHLYYPSTAAPLNKTLNHSIPNPAPKKSLTDYQQKVAENYARLVKEREERFKNLQKGFDKKQTSFLKSQFLKPHPPNVIKLPTTEQTLPQTLLKFDDNYQYPIEGEHITEDPLQPQNAEMSQNPSIPEKRSCDCGRNQHTMSEESVKSSQAGWNCHHAKPSQVPKNTNILTKQSKSASDCTCEDNSSRYLESETPSCGCRNSLEKIKTMKSTQPCTCERHHDDCDDENSLRSPRSHPEPSKYDILNSMLLWLKRFGNNKIAI